MFKRYAINAVSFSINLHLMNWSNYWFNWYTIEHISLCDNLDVSVNTISSTRLIFLLCWCTHHIFLTLRT